MPQKKAITINYNNDLVILHLTILAKNAIYAQE